MYGSTGTQNIVIEVDAAELGSKRILVAEVRSSFVNACGCITYITVSSKRDIYNRTSIGSIVMKAKCGEDGPKSDNEALSYFGG